MPELTSHYRLGPSSASRWLFCPYSLRAPSSPAGKAADEGNEAHKYGAEVLMGERTLDSVPVRFYHGLRTYVEHVQANRIEPIVERQWESLEIPASATTHLPPREDIKEGYGGTLDCLMVEGDTAAVYDLKWGEHKVKAANNLQLLSYASLVHEHFAVSTFHAVIVQPNAKGGPNISATEFSEQEVVDHRGRVKAAAASEEKQPGFCCLFCPLRYNKECQEGVEYARKKNWKYKV